MTKNCITFTLITTTTYLILPVCNNRLLNFSYLDGKHNERYKYHDDHQELWGPNLWRDISETNRREGDHAEVKGVEQGQVIACSFQVLDTADADQNQFRKTENEEEKRKKGSFWWSNCSFEVAQEAI